MVGFLRFEIDEGMVLKLGYPFLPPDPAQSPNFEHIFGDQLPVGSVVQVWDQTDRWVGVVKASRSGWWPRDVYLNPGDGARLYAAAGRGSPSASVLLMGEVPVTEYQPGDPCLGPMMTMPFVSHPYPEPLPLPELDRVFGLPGGAMVFAWDYPFQGYSVFAKSQRAGWSLDAVSFVIEPATAVWVSGGAWQQSCLPYDRPYDWPTTVLPGSSEGVEILGMGLTEEGIEIQWTAPVDSSVFGIEGSNQWPLPDWMPMTTTHRLVPGTNVWIDTDTGSTTMRIYRASGFVLP